MNGLYDISDAADISGLRFRPFAGVADADGLRAVHLGRAERDEIDLLSTLEGISTREEFIAALNDVTARGLEDRTIVAEIDGQIVGYGRIFDWLEGDGTRVWLTIGWVLPEWRGRGLGTALLHWTERRIRALAAEQPGPWEFAGNASSTEIEATALLLDNGYRAAYTVLEMGLEWAAFAPSIGLSEGVEVRPAEPEHTPYIAASVMEAYRNEYEGGRYSEGVEHPDTYAAELNEPRYDPSLWRVAWAGDEVVGQVIPRIEKGRAEIYEVSVRPAWRRRGLARALLSLALLELQSRGVEVVRLHTVAEFPTQAHRMYNSLGFRTLKEFPRYRKPA